MIRVVAAAADFSDWAALLRLLQQAFAFMDGRINPPSSLHQFTLESLVAKSRAETLFLAMDGDEVLGCIFARPQGDALYVGKLAVRPGHQGCGIGRRLTAVAEQCARDAGLRWLELDTRIELLENHRAFAALGFARTAERAHPGFDRPTFITMRKATMKTALLVIDVQQALCAGEWACFDIQNILPRINGLTAKARAAGALVILVQHEEDEGSLQPGSDGWQLAAALDAQPGDIRVSKRTPDSFHRTDLQALLQERGVTELVICGLQSDFCVDTTTRRALALGYPVTLVADAHSTLDNGVLTAAQITAHHNTTLGNMCSFGQRARLVAAADVSIAA